MLDSKEQCTVVLKLKFIKNQASLDVTNNTQETVIFEPKQMLGILDLRSLGYYNIRKRCITADLSICFILSQQRNYVRNFNTLVNQLKKDKKISRKISIY